MMTRQEILKTVRKVVAETLFIEEDGILEESSLQADLGADSLDEVSLLMAIQDAFTIEIPDEEALKIKTIKEVVDKVAEKKNSQAALFAPILEVIREIKNEPAFSAVQPESDLADLAFDSLDLIKFVMGIENHFDIDIPDTEIEGLKTINDLVACIQKRIT